MRQFADFVVTIKLLQIITGDLVTARVLFF